jgi:hypothetical protein
MEAVKHFILGLRSTQAGVEAVVTGDRWNATFFAGARYHDSAVFH